MYCADEVLDAGEVDVTVPSTRMVTVRVVWSLTSASSPPDAVKVPDVFPLAATESMWPSFVLPVYGCALVKSELYEPSALYVITAPAPPVTVTSVPLSRCGNVPPVAFHFPTTHGSIAVALGFGVAVAIALAVAVCPAAGDAVEELPQPKEVAEATRIAAVTSRRHALRVAVSRARADVGGSMGVRSTLASQVTGAHHLSG